PKVSMKNLFFSTVLILGFARQATYLHSGSSWCPTFALPRHIPGKPPKRPFGHEATPQATEALFRSALQEFGCVFQHAFCHAVATNHAGNLLDSFAGIQTDYLCNSSPLRHILGNEIMTVCIGGNLWKMSHANNLILLRKPSELLSDD